jgi:predicted AlkP superfamily pyrophosphatase or phosphodiesterase
MRIKIKKTTCVILLGMAQVTSVVMAQTNSAKMAVKTKLERPKLVVGIVVDQMRYDYLYRFYDKYGEDGFKRMMREGFTARNHHYHYGNTSTGAGHSSIYSGSAPAVHGIIGNDWYVPTLDRKINCVEDSTVLGVGTRKASVGRASPRNMLVTTVTDQLRLATNFRSKTISIALKDRAAILPGGHSANGSYWYDGYTGNWITSTFYRKDLPEWVEAFNERKLPSTYLAKGWQTLLPIAEYTESTLDDQAYEARFTGNSKPVFPYDLAGQAGNAFDLMGSTPWGNTLTKEMAFAAIKGENLGKGEFTDFLALSFSAPDGVGHRFGPNSIEQEDVYLRLDKEFADIFTFLDKWVGKGQYTVFLSADHGVMDVPEFLANNSLPGHRIDFGEIDDRIMQRVDNEFGVKKLIKAISLRQVYFDKQMMKAKGITIDQVLEVIRDEVADEPAIADVLNARKLGEATTPEYFRKLFLNEINTKRSGELLLVPQVGYIGRANYGTTHGSPYNYDTHVPFVMFGWGVQPGETLRRTHICDIAPTVSALLRILPPSGSIGEVVVEALKKK